MKVKSEEVEEEELLEGVAEELEDDELLAALGIPLKSAFATALIAPPVGEVAVPASVSRSFGKSITTAPLGVVAMVRLLPETFATRSIKVTRILLVIAPGGVAPEFISLPVKVTVRLVMLLVAAWAVALPVNAKRASVSLILVRLAVRPAGTFDTVPSVTPVTPLNVSPEIRIVSVAVTLPSLVLLSASS